MLIFQAAYAFASPPTPHRTPDHAKSIAIGASIAVHLVVGAYVLTAVVRPTSSPQSDTSDPPMVVQRFNVPPKQPLPPTTPLRTPPTTAHAPSMVSPRTVAILTPQTPTTSPSGTFGSIRGADTTGPFEPPPAVSHVITNPAWLSRPDAGQIAGAYPERAARGWITGLVTLDCQVAATGAVGACNIIQETPPARVSPRQRLGSAVCFA